MEQQVGLLIILICSSLLRERLLSRSEPFSRTFHAFVFFS